MQIDKKIQTKYIKDYIESCLNLKLDTVTRKRNYVYARALYFKLCREQTVLSLSDIGATLNMDHASVLHAINNAFPNAIFYDKYLKSVYRDFTFANKHKRKNIYKNYANILLENTRLRNEVDSIGSEHGLDCRFVKLINQIPEDKKDDVYVKFSAIVNIVNSARERELI